MELGETASSPACPQVGQGALNSRKEGYDWVFTDGSVDLFRMLSIPIRRHVRIRSASNPYDPAQASYFAARRARQRQEASKRAPEWLFSDAPPSRPR